MKKYKKRSFTLFMERIAAKIKENKFFYLACIMSFALLLLSTYFTFISGQNFSSKILDNFAVGKVAERDIIASRSISYIDEEATNEKKREQKKNLVPVFNFDTEITSQVLRDLNTFTSEFAHASDYEDADSFASAVEKKFPDKFSPEVLRSFFDTDYDTKMRIISSLAKQIMDMGIIAIPNAEELAEYKSDEVELVTKVDNAQQFSTVKTEDFLSLDRLDSYVNDLLKGINKQNLSKGILSIMRAFLKPNVCYDKISTERKLELALNEVVPVTIVIPEGESIVSAGFIVTEESYAKLKRLSRESYNFDRKLIVGWTLLLLTVFILGGFLFSHTILGKSLSKKNRFILLFSMDILYLIVLWLSKLPILSHHLQLMVFLPVTLFVMLTAILISKQVAVLQAIIMSVGILIPINFNLSIMLYALFSSLAGLACIHISDKRIDLIKTALELTLINPLLAFMMLLLFQEPIAPFPLLLGTAINGFMTGIFILGFLPILESGLNIPTNFRLMELSDLNSDILKRMLLTVPGTYNHSILLANLAEAACRKIGANPLLARVGAYYHDIGKMENPEYFVENQTGDNKHNELNPRLSATVIRSHTKLGIIKGRELHLPEEVINMIASHHGDGVISYFYRKAQELEGANVSKVDFSYPGPRPKTKEASVVMLADVVEAACRAKIAKEKVNDLNEFFSRTIDTLVKAKIEADQLSESELSMGEITVVKQTFAEILTGYYHARIDYPPEKKNIPTENQAFASQEKKSSSVSEGSSEEKGVKQPNAPFLTTEPQNAPAEASTSKTSTKKSSGTAPAAKNAAKKRTAKPITAAAHAKTARTTAAAKTKPQVSAGTNDKKAEANVK